ncbi:short chain dehydrogenase [Benzoatithermus flavus]|uniref:Short chain dehydrogenase n=1 Tax=Benzoatithermus flavus TaxID=3108223 RepID=A0ABU8XWL2_9PROT
MRIVLVGATGTIGRAVAKELGERHEIVAVGSRSGDVHMDITEAASIRAGFERIGRVDAVVSAAGKVKFAPLETMTEADYWLGLKDKLMGQVNLVLIGRDFVNDGGSFTLTSGVLSHDPIRFGSSASMVNGAIDAFVRAAAIELPRGLRINAVSPGVLLESMPSYGPYFRGHEPVPAARVALAYAKSVEGLRTGQVFSVL